MSVKNWENSISDDIKILVYVYTRVSDSHVFSWWSVEDQQAKHVEIPHSIHTCTFHSNSHQLLKNSSHAKSFPS